MAITPKTERNIRYRGNQMFSGRITIDPYNTIVDYDNCIAPISWIATMNDFHFDGDGTSGAVQLPELAISGSLWLFADTSVESFGGGFQVPRTTRSALKGNWKYQEVLDADGFVVAIEPRTVFDENYTYSLYYRAPYTNVVTGYDIM